MSSSQGFEGVAVTGCKRPGDSVACATLFEAQGRLPAPL